MDNTENATWELYGLTEDEWNALTDAERQAYLDVGEQEVNEEPDMASEGETIEEVEV